MNNISKTAKTFTLIILVCLISASVAFSQSGQTLRFNSDGTFKIVQFTDIHLSYNTSKSDSALALIRKVISEEKPDLIIVTGDVVCSANTRETWIEVTKPFIDSHTPWAVVLGNHDDEFELKRAEIIALIEKLPYCMTVNGPDEIAGNGNYVMKISSSQADATAALLYCFDSHSYSTIKGLKGYGWISFNQVQWYRQQSEVFKIENGNKPLPALSFLHIPLPEYKEIKSLNTTAGDNNENPCSPLINTGLFAAMKEMGDVIGVFAGHDHVNTYIGCLYDICLGYGCKTGYENYGYLEKGARVIVLYEGEREFKTWIRHLDPTPLFTVTYPESFTTEEK